MPERWREIAREATRQRMERHAHSSAVAAAVRIVPFSTAWEARAARGPAGAHPVGRLARRGGRDAPAGGGEYARRPHAELLVEGEGEPPLAWQGARLSKAIGDFLARTGYS